MELERKHLLNENAMSQKVLQEFSLPFRPFKRLDPEEQAEAFANSLSKMSEKMLKKSGNKNLKSILSSKGDFKKIKAYKDFEKTFNYIKVQKSKGFNPTIVSAFDTVENSVKLLEKYKSDFKKSFTNGNEIGQITYASIAASALLVVTQIFFLGFEKNEKGILEITNNKLKNKDSIELKTLNNILMIEKNKKFRDIFKIDGSIVNTNESFDSMYKSFMKNKDKYKENFGKVMDADISKDTINKAKEAGTALNRSQKASLVIFGSIGALAVSMLVMWATKQAYIKFIKFRSDFAEYLRDAVSIIEGEKDNNIDKTTREKQEKMAERLSKLADKIDIEDGVAEVQARSESEKIDSEISKELENDFDIKF